MNIYFFLSLKRMFFRIEYKLMINISNREVEVGGLRGLRLMQVIVIMWGKILNMQK